MANKNDERILELRKQIQEKKDKLGKIGRFTAITNCIVEIDGKNINLNVLDKEKLIALAVKLNAYLMSAKALGLAEQYKISNNSVSDWITDIMGKLDILNKKDEEKSLSLMEAKLEKMLSDEKQVELELDAIADLLK